MKNIVEFNSMDEFIAYRKNITLAEIGSGSEGICYLGKDGFIYKDLTEGCFPYSMDVNSIITSDDIKVDNFIFPDVLFAENSKLIGYRSKYIQRNLFDTDYLFREGIKEFDFNKLMGAYYDICNDAEKLADAHIEIFDLSYNLIFDGEKLYGIDTDHYKVVDYPVREHNIVCVNSAIKNEFIMIADYIFEENIHGIFSNTKVVDFLNFFEERFKNNSNGSLATGGYQFIKK